MSMLFGRDLKTIGKHINNALREELSGESGGGAKFATPKKYGRREGFEQTQYPEYYSLEMMTSSVTGQRAETAFFSDVGPIPS